MSMLADVVFIGTVGAYFAATVVFFRFLAKPVASPRAARAAPRLLGLAAVLHLGYVLIASFAANVCPVKSIHFVASIAACVAAFLYLALRRVARIDALGAFVAPVALTFVLASRFVGAPDHVAFGGLLAVHVTVNVLGDALFLLASGAAVLYLIEERRLKEKRPASLFGALPPLDALDLAEHRLLLIGFPMLTIGIITGTVWAHRIENGSPAETARALFAYATWVLIGSVLVFRTVLGWRGRRAAYFTIAGFLCAVAVLVVYLVRGPVGGAT